MTAALLSLILAATPVAAPSQFPAELRPLLSALARARYVVKLEPPPMPGAYGQTDSRRRRIWIAPVTLELGIMRASLIHEAVHAAQGCPNGIQKPIGWSIPLTPLIEREIRSVLYRNYAHNKFEVEREAFGMQSHPQALALIIQALERRCLPR